MWYKYALKYAYAALTIKGSILAAMTGNQEIAKSLDTIFSNPKHRLHEDYKKVLLQMYLNKELNIYTDDSVDIEIEEKTSEDTFVDTFLMSEAIYIIIYSLYIYVMQHGPFFTSTKNRIFGIKDKKFDKVAIHLRDTDLMWEIICNDPRFKELKEISVDIVSSRPLTSYSHLNDNEIHIPKWFQRYLINKVPKEIPFLHFDTGFEGSIPMWMTRNGWNVADIKLVSTDIDNVDCQLPFYQIDFVNQNKNLEFNHSFVINNFEHVPHRLEHIVVNITKQKELLNKIKLTRKDSLIFKLMHETNNSEERVFYKLVDMARKKYGFNNETAKKHIYQALLKTDASNFNIGEAIKAIKSSYQEVIKKFQIFINNSNNDEEIIIDSRELNRLIKPILDMDMQDINISWLELDNEETDIMDPDLFSKITFKYSKNMPAFWASYFIVKEYFDIQREIADDFETKYSDLKKNSKNNKITTAFYNKLKEHLKKYFPDTGQVKHLISLIKDKNETTYIPLNNNSNILIRETLIKSMKEAMKKKPEPNVFAKTVEILKHHSLKIPKFIIRTYNKSKSFFGKKRLEPLLENLTIKDIIEKSFIDKLSKKDQDLINAIMTGDIEKVRIALMDGVSANLSVPYKEDGDTNWREYSILSYAIIENQLPIVKLLIDFGANVNQVNNYGESPLYLAVFLNEMKIAELLIKNDANMYHNFNIDNKTNIIDYIISNDNIEMFKLFAENGLDLNIANSRGDSLLGMAVRYFSLKIVKFLLDNGANMYHNFDNCNNYYTNIINYIISRDNLEIFKLFVENGLDINIINPDGQSLLGIATRCSSLQIIEFLLKNGADMYHNFDANDDTNIINQMIYSNNLEIFKLFVENGLDLNATNSKGESLFTMAVKHSTYHIAEFLLDKLDNNVNIYQFDKGLGTSPLEFVISNNNWCILELFIEKGLLDINGPQINSLIKMVIDNFSARILKFLVDEGVDISEKALGYDILSYLAKQPYSLSKKILEFLIDRRIGNLNLALQTAAIYNNEEAGKLFLKNGANSNSIDESGETPLHHTCRNNNLDFSRLLINYGANPNIQNKFGYTALGIVIDSHQNAELIRMLLEAGADPNIGPPGKEPIKFIKEYYGE